MGNLVFSEMYSDPDRSLILKIKGKKIKDIYECLDNLANFYPTNTTLTSEEFNDIFGSLMDETDEFFVQMSNDNSIEGVIDVYECFATTVLLCGEELDTKLRFIYGLFDFDRSGIIEEKELLLSLQSAIRGLCKIAALPVPSLLDIEEYSAEIFSKIDSDKSNSIEYEEFEKYVKSSYELQDFLLRYAMTQTYENAARRHNVFYSESVSLFDELLKSSEEENVPAEIIFQKIKEAMVGLEGEIYEELTTILLNTSNYENPNIDSNLINRNSYLKVMNAWSAFTATDINGDGTISREELRYLLFAYEKEKCDEFRLDFEMKELDSDSSGEITRKEFLNYLCTDKGNSGKVVFRTNIKALFKKYDIDNSGYLNMTELKNLIRDNLKSCYLAAKAKGGHTLENVEGMIGSLVEEIIRDIDVKGKGDGDTVISWNEFRDFMEKALIEQEKLRKFLGSSI